MADASILIQLQDLLNADGLVVVFRNALYKTGMLPEDKPLLTLLHWLSSADTEGIFHTNKLGHHYSDALPFGDMICGLVYVSLGKKSSQDCILWTRLGSEKAVNWGGDPNKAMSLEEGQLAPRKSFALWKQLVKGQSKDWRPPEINAAGSICSAIQHRLHLKDLQEKEEIYLDLNRRLKAANDELFNMNWISTHDLKEPLRKIQLYASLILERNPEIPELVKTNVIRMQASASKMQLLIEDLFEYSKVVYEEKQFIDIDINALLKEIQSDLETTIQEKNAQLLWENLPHVSGIPFQIRQLFINLISNSLKFTEPGRPPVITINSETVSVTNSNTQALTKFHKITVTDNGIGFNNSYSDHVFKVFQKIHRSKYEGSGIGLAICKKIAEIHNGWIEASGEEGKGASFSVYFPRTVVDRENIEPKR